MFAFWRRRTLRRHAIPDAEWDALRARLPLLDGLAEAELALLRTRATEFLASKVIAPSEGFELADEERLEIATWASLPVLHRGISAYDGFHGVIVYPEEFLAPREEIDEAGVVHIGHEEVSGESWDAGPILLSWADVEASREPGQGSVVVHECVHKLDMGDGEMNGVPALEGTGIGYAEWAAVMREAWEAMGREEAEEGETLLDDYALESPAEFFAVFSEEFFTAPELLRESAPRVYALLVRYYGVDPLRWWRGLG